MPEGAMSCFFQLHTFISPGLLWNFPFSDNKPALCGTSSNEHRKKWRRSGRVIIAHPHWSKLGESDGALQHIFLSKVKWVWHKRSKEYLEILFGLHKPSSLLRLLENSRGKSRCFKVSFSWDKFIFHVTHYLFSCW